MRKFLLLQLTAALLCVSAMGTTLIEITGENPVALSYTMDLHTGYNLLSNPFKNETTVEKLFQFSEIPLNAEVYNTAGVKLATRKQQTVGALNNGQWTYVTTAYWDVNASIPTGSAFFLRIVDYFVPGSKLKMLGSAVCGAPQTQSLVAGNNYIAPLFPQNGLTPSNLPMVDGMIVYTHTIAGFTCHFYEEEFGWEPSEPIIQDGTAFIVNYPSAQTWTQTICEPVANRTMLPFVMDTIQDSVSLFVYTPVNYLEWAYRGPGRVFPGGGSQPSNYGFWGTSGYNWINPAPSWTTCPGQPVWAGGAVYQTVYN